MVATRMKVILCFQAVLYIKSRPLYYSERNFLSRKEKHFSMKGSFFILFIFFYFQLNNVFSYISYIFNNFCNARD